VNKNIILVALAILSSIELKACSFLRRYGANSYITNTPLFFKRQDPDAPQAKGVDRYEARETIIMEDNVDTTGKVKSKKTDTLKRRRRANS
jgi:hypothetical protein